jgi:transcriptional regulator with XRE-family HTH domain
MPPSPFGERLLLLRRRARMSQAALGAAIGVSAHTIGQLERGAIQTLRGDVIVAAAQVLQTSTDFLLGLTPPQESLWTRPHPPVSATR